VKTVTVRVHEIAVDGLPDMERLVGQVAFIFDGAVVSGWPLNNLALGLPHWEADSDVGHNQPFSGVTHWLEFPVPVQELTR
jgi:hypothetical protein